MRHLITLIIKSTVCTVAKFVPKVLSFHQFVICQVNEAKQHTFAQLRSEQMRRIQYKNICVFLRYRDFRDLFWLTVYTIVASHSAVYNG